MNARERGEPFKLIVYKLHNFFFSYHRPSLETITPVKRLERRFLLELLYGLNISLFCSWTIIVTAIHFGVRWIQLDEWRRGRECEEDCAEAVRRLQPHMGEDIIQPIMGGRGGTGGRGGNGSIGTGRLHRGGLRPVGSVGSGNGCPGRAGN